MSAQLVFSLFSLPLPQAVRRQSKTLQNKTLSCYPSVTLRFLDFCKIKIYNALKKGFESLHPHNIEISSIKFGEISLFNYFLIVEVLADNLSVRKNRKALLLT